MSVNWGNDVYYWSFDPAGGHRIPSWVAEALGFPELAQLIWYRPSIFEDYQYEATRQFQELRGYDPLTQEFARKHGLPLIDIVEPPPDEDGDVWYDAEEGLDPSKDLESPYPSSHFPTSFSKSFNSCNFGPLLVYRLAYVRNASRACKSVPAAASITWDVGGDEDAAEAVNEVYDAWEKESSEERDLE
ncbi:hypothetical protein VKT23_012119 [Stygiomarasmius scandens]|uniref:Uncharacterized protein n=1 Tax=Marasmiellus scandens TaxID=2682957 RepID=A0ABR1JBL8_9AGAR